jgi:primosomal protein N' (replication factor Y)
MSSQVTYVDVILPLPLPQAYTYAVPVDIVEFVKIGQRVIVQFGKNRYYSAIVKHIHHDKPAVDVKLIESIAEEDVMNAALPSG